MDEIKLKPCPFCGSKRVLSNLYSREAKPTTTRTLSTAKSVERRTGYHRERGRAG